MKAGGFYKYGDGTQIMHQPFDKRTIESLLDDEVLDESPDIYTKIFIGGLNSITTNGK